MRRSPDWNHCQTALHRGRITIEERPDGPAARFDVRLPLTDTSDTVTATLPLLRRDWLTTGTAEPQSFHKSGS